MRLIGAGLFVFAGMLLLVVLLGSRKAPSWLVGFGIAIVMVALMVLALWLFNAKWSDPLGRRTAEEHRRVLEKLGLLESTTFRATRAFGVEEFEDEGLHYFLELTDGRVLFLSGQYLYDYEPISDDPETNQPRLFPSTEFTVRRHKKEGYVVTRSPRTALSSNREVMAPSFGKDVWQRRSRARRRPRDHRHPTGAID